MPYWTFFAMGFADLLDSWLYVPNPQSDLEKRINIFVSEDKFCRIIWSLLKWSSQWASFSCNSAMQ